MRLVYSAIQTPDGTILESNYRHDYREYTDTLTGETYMIDGGIDYRRGNINVTPAKDLSVCLEDGHELVREAVKWGTRGINGDKPLRFVKLCDMETAHIEACLRTQNMHSHYVQAFVDELKYRDKNYCRDISDIQKEIKVLESKQEYLETIVEILQLLEKKP